MGGGGSTNTETNTNLLPSYLTGAGGPVQDYITRAKDMAVGASKNYTPYTGESYATQNTHEQNGIYNLYVRALGGDNLERAGQDVVGDRLDGNDIGTNPKLNNGYTKSIEKIIQEFEEETLPNIRKNFVYAFGSSQHNIAEAKATESILEVVSKIAQGVYYDDYRQEREQQDNALAHTIQYGMQSIRDIEMMRQAGKYKREYLQGYYNDLWARHNDDQLVYVKNLNILGNAFRVLFGTYRDESLTLYNPPLMTKIAGLAMTGLSIAGMFRSSSGGQPADGAMSGYMDSSQQFKQNFLSANQPEDHSGQFTMNADFAIGGNVQQ